MFNFATTNCSCSSLCQVWRLSERVGAECEQTLRGHWGAVHAIAVLPDDAIVTGGADRVIARWDLGTGQCTRVLGGHVSAINAIATTRAHDSMRGGTQIASGGGNVRLWTLGGSAQQPPPSICAAEATLVSRFNEATASGEVGPESNAFNLWEAVKAVFNPATSDTADKHENDEEAKPGIDSADESAYTGGTSVTASHAHAYADLTTAYPSSVSMFAVPYAPTVHSKSLRAGAGKNTGRANEQYESLHALARSGSSGQLGARMSLDDTWAAMDRKLSAFSKDMKGELHALFSKLDQHEMNPLKELKGKVTFTTHTTFGPLSHCTAEIRHR